MRLPSPTRRTEGIRVRGRSARVVDEVLRATLEEIGRVGYAALRVEDVATRSAVNKTTIYRRWPTKSELVGAAIQEFAQAPDVPDTGSLREDLLTLLRIAASRAQSPLGRGLMRMFQTEREHPEVDALMQPVAQRQIKVRLAVVERAIERGELPPGTSAELVAELAFAPVFRRISATHRPADDAFLEAVVDIVVAGARTGAAVRGAPAPQSVRTGRTRALRSRS